MPCVYGIGERDITLTADTLTSEQRADLADLARDRRRRPPKRQRDAERQREAEALAASVAASGWKSCEGTEILQCRCGHIGPAAADFCGRRIANGRGPIVVCCRSCAAKGAPCLSNASE